MVVLIIWLPVSLLVGDANDVRGCGSNTAKGKCLNDEWYNIYLSIYL